MGTITATTADLALALGTVMHAASKDAARPVLHSVMLEPGRLGVRAVAADNYRIAVRDFAGTADGPMILDLDDAATLHNLIKAERVTSDVAITEDNPDRGTATWAYGARTIGLRLIDGTFPNYLQVIPPDTRKGDLVIGIAGAYIAEAAKALAPSKPGLYGQRAGANLRVTLNTDPRAPVIVRPQDPDSTAFEVIMPVALR